MDSSELYHHGVKGMKWGHRKATYAKMAAKNKSHKAAVKEYGKKFDKASKASDLADEMWNNVKAERKTLGKNFITRTIASMQNKTDAAKKYNKDYDMASKKSDIADKLWREAHAAYKKTGRNYVDRIFNNVKYG